MNDLYHWLGNDLATGVTGDLAPIDGTVKGQQRILRRLFTNPGDYIAHPTYGGGLGKRVGRQMDVAGTTAVIREQLALESVVAQTPAPVITMAATPDGVLSVNIAYNDAPSGTQQTLSFNINI